MPPRSNPHVAPQPAQPQRYAPPSAGELQLGLVSDADAMGAWGHTAPLLLVAEPPSSCNSNQGDTVMLSFTATAQVPTASVGSSLRFRLVIVDVSLLRAACPGITPGAAIMAVENMQGQPDSVALIIDHDSSSSSSSPVAHARIDLNGRVLHFARAEKQFPFLSQLSLAAEGEKNTLKAGPLLSLTLYGNDPSMRYDRAAWLDSLPPHSRETVLHLEQHGDDVAATSRSGIQLLPTSLVEVDDVYPVRSEGCCWCEGHLPNPAPMKRQMSVVKESIKRHKKHRSLKNETELPQHTSGHKPPSTRGQTALSTGGASKEQGQKPLPVYENVRACYEDDANTAVMRRGWCVEPLHIADPISPFSAGEPQCTMRAWHTTVNVAPLADCGIQLEMRMPLLVYSDTSDDSDDTCSQLSSLQTYSYASSARAVVGVRWVRCFVVLQPPLFKQHTSGLLAIPFSFSDASPDGGGHSTLGAATTHWHTIYVQYLFVFPFQHAQRNTLMMVRSIASLKRLATTKPVGHRGLGKTYTRTLPDEATDADAVAPSTRMARRLTVKLAENSLEAFNAAHRRGCDMVEFDVMLTQDRVPVIFHDPLIRLQARVKRGAGTRNGRVEWQQPSSSNSFEFGVSPTFASDPIPHPQFADFLTSDSSSVLPAVLQEVCQQNAPNFASVTVALHQLTKRQLDVVMTETFTYMKAGNKLRSLILRHMNQILRVYRNRQRAKYRSDLHLEAKEEENEFSGCMTPECVGGQLLNPACSGERMRNQKRILSEQEDVTNRICTLQDLFENTPVSLRFNLEVKFPFQPIGDSNLYQQTNAFEINDFVDDILRVVFDYADQRQVVVGKGDKGVEQPRDVIFSSFEPDVCLALKLKQSRFDVVFLCDTEPSNDFKDYRCFGLVEGALQFSTLMNLSGVSIYASSLCTKAQRHIPSTRNRPRLPQQPVSLQRPDDGDENELDDTNSIASGSDGVSGERDAQWSSFDYSRGRDIVAYAHDHKQLLWTWGEVNNDKQFTYVQLRLMKVDAIITDHVPT
ncbi:hypothetical protein DQ04_04291030 [Trypanosoma grayi]|uniref:hypothetical protein n=1 Tax=Trypanosoma grayi TaxID=71804 RepID=UPI0004F42938|nr:hypothetical protein DQ04_04291030 [Trypanosoma grayi]KEG10023.1 hypothetical protein DQ04_04291030 [Trypanosoma grayi]